MIDIKDSISLMILQKKLNVKQLEQIASSNKTEILSDLIISLQRLICIDPFKQITRQDSSQKDSAQETKSEESQKDIIIKKLTEDDAIGLFNVLQVLYNKFHGTKYEWAIRQIAQNLLKMLKPMPGFNRIQKSMSLTFIFHDNNNNSDLDVQQSIKHTIKTNTLSDNIDNVLDWFNSLHDVYKYLQNKLLIMLTEHLNTLKKKDRLDYLKSCLKIFLKIIPPLSLQIQVQKNALSQCRRFQPSLQVQFFKNYSNILKPLSKILNEMILCPSELQLQLDLFVLLRRMYHLWGQPVQNPIFTVISNIALYSKNDSDLKQLAIFAYKIIQQKKDMYLGIQLQNSQAFNFLKQSAYFSSKALAYLDESYCNYSTTDIKLPFWKLHSNIGAGQLKQYPVLINKSGTLLCWQIRLKGYDIKYGIYKVQDMRKLSQQDYQEQKSCKAVIKLQTIVSNKHGNCGSMLLKPGIYKIVIDNSFSYLRSKQYAHSFVVLQPI